MFPSKVHTIVALITLIFHCTCIASDKQYSFTLNGSLFETVGNKVKVDPLLLYAIAITESAIHVGSGYIGPTPYVFRTSDGPKYFRTRKEAASELQEIIKTTSHVDIGMMQINLHYHPQKNPLQLLDPHYNLIVAANYLKTTMDSTSDLIVGVGRYHSWTSSLSNWYGERVWQTYRNLLEIMAYN